MSDLIDSKNYKYPTWQEKFPDDNVDVFTLNVGKSWEKMFKKLKESGKWAKLNKKLSEDIKNSIDIFPRPDLVFNAFASTPRKDVKVVIIGQDCYFNAYMKEGVKIPEAMGLSFSVPLGIKIPSSLGNIFRNMIKFKHIKQFPDHGNLQSWANQGCLLLNSALTVREGEKNTHQDDWSVLTDKIIKKLSDKREHLVFVLWGAFAFKKMDLIDTDKHRVIVSSHPSGLSNTKPMGKYPAFSDFDHFGTINTYLKEFDEGEINWELK